MTKPVDLDELKRIFKSNMGTTREEAQIMLALIEELEALRELSVYARHDDECRRAFRENRAGSCICGYADASSRVEALRGKDAK